MNMRRSSSYRKGKLKWTNRPSFQAKSWSNRPSFQDKSWEGRRKPAQVNTRGIFSKNSRSLFEKIKEKSQKNHRNHRKIIKITGKITKTRKNWKKSRKHHTKITKIMKNSFWFWKSQKYRTIFCEWYALKWIIIHGKCILRDNTVKTRE